MSKIKWKELPVGIAGFDAIPSVIDWTDPTHVPLMVAEAVYEIGNLSELLDECENVELETVAIDAMPRGRDAVMGAVQTRARELAVVNGWSDWLTESHTGRYPWE